MPAPQCGSPLSQTFPGSARLFFLLLPGLGSYWQLSLEHFSKEPLAGTTSWHYCILSIVFDTTYYHTSQGSIEVSLLKLATVFKESRHGCSVTEDQIASKGGETCHWLRPNFSRRFSVFVLTVVSVHSYSVINDQMPTKGMKPEKLESQSWLCTFPDVWLTSVDISAALSWTQQQCVSHFEPSFTQTKFTCHI